VNSTSANAEAAIVGAASPARQLACALAARGALVRVWDADPALAAGLAESWGGCAEASLEALIGAMRAPRLLWLAADSAEACSLHLNQLGALLESGDAVVAAGEADFRRLPEHGRDLDARGVALADAALVAGDWGAAHARLLAVGTQVPVPDTIAAGLDVAAHVPRGAWIPCGPPGSARFVALVAAEGRKGLAAGLADGFETIGRAGVQLQLGDLIRAWRQSGERNAALGRLAKDYLDAIGWDAGRPGVPPAAVTLAMSLRFASQGLELYLAQLSTLFGSEGSETAATGPVPGHSR